MFSNATQSIPQRFLDKMEVDRKVKDAEIKIADYISSFGNVLTIEQCRHIRECVRRYREKLKPLYEKQEFLRKSCEAFIAQRRAGPGGTA